MKVAIITDTHYGFKRGSKYVCDYFESFYRDVFFPTLEKEGITTVIHMGDAFDSRKGIDYQSLDWAKRVVFEPLSKYDVHMMVDDSLLSGHSSDYNQIKDNIQYKNR